jgi:hypothetical protein
MRRAFSLLLIFTVACSSGLESKPRARFNRGIEFMAEGKLDRAERALMDARKKAGGDQLLRYRSAFNLGLLFVRKAEEASAEPETALGHYRSAQGWFQDAARIVAADKDAQVNLQIVGRRIQMLADQLNRGQNGLEARLDAAIAAERELREGIRELMEGIEASGAKGEPIAFRAAFDAMADRHRTLLGEVGTVLDLAGDELTLLSGKPEEEQTLEDQVRMAQLSGIEHYVTEARQAMDDARRRLRGLQASASHLRSTAALAALKRAREQLLDPVTVLQAVAQDEAALLQYTETRRVLSKGQVKLETGEVAKAPAWLAPELLVERQSDAHSRASEILMRFEAATAKPPQPQGQEQDPKMARMIEMAGRASPHLREASDAMAKAQDALGADDLELAVKRETEALRALARAIEYFSDLKTLIEVAYGEHVGVVQLLDPEAEKVEAPDEEPMTARQRAKKGLDTTALNLDRLERMTALIQEALEQARGQAQAQAQQGGGGPPEGIEETYGAAEKLRAAAAGKLAVVRDGLQAVVDGKRPPSGEAAPLAQARLAQKDLEDLRRIFFTIVQHLKELHQRQSDTYDQTGTAAAADDTEHGALLPPLATREKEHSTVAQALAEALESQADAAAGAQDPQMAEQSKKLAAAAAEVRLAIDAMEGASQVLSQAAEDAMNMSVDFSAALEEQPVALEHIENAIRILEPPQNQNQDQQEQNQDQNQDEQNQGQDQNQEQAERKLQRIRDREAERQRERAQAAQEEPVEKDW